MDVLKGFTIELELDNMKVDSGLTDLKSSMRLMNSEMRKNMSAFDYGEKSLKKYGTQLDGLKKKYEAQKVVVEAAHKSYEKMVNEHGEGSKQAQEAAANYNHESAQLNNLERHISKVTKEMESFRREQEVQSSTMFKAGDALEGFGNKLSGISSGLRDIGGSLTKKITLPALGAATAIGGITAAFGWQRLVGLDSAQAQLRGLGYEAEEVERISKQVTTAIEGGMTTMAEGTAVAAGALAAGVKEGAELERYIKLVGDAAVGSERPVNDMAQIFNRVQGQGKLMTQELNMIEQGMPGFAQAMADNLSGGSLEAFRQMVTNGEVGSKEFLDVMEGFAGGMAEAYSDSWSGMVANTKAYVGIIGENLLGGIFEESKEALSEFIDILSSEETVNWAKEMGEIIGSAFTSIVTHVKSGIKWFNNLSDSQQKAIMKFGAIAIAAGPIIAGFGILGGVIAKLSSGLGVFLKFLAPVTKGFSLFGGKAAAAGKSVGILRTAFSLLTGPVGIVIGVLTILSGIFVTLYKKSETFRNMLSSIGGIFKDVFSSIIDWAMPGFDAVRNFMGDLQGRFREFMTEEGPGIQKSFENITKVLGIVGKFIADRVVKEFKNFQKVIEFVMPIAEFIIKGAWSSIKNIISTTLDVILGAVKVFSGLFTGDWSKMWEGLQEIGKSIMKLIWHYIKDSWIGKIISAVINFRKDFNFTISDMWQRVKKVFTEKIKQIVTDMSNSFVGKIIKSGITLKDDFIGLASDMWTGVKKKFDDIVDGAKALPKRIGDGIRNAKSKATDGMKSVGNGVITAAKKPFNKVISGVEWIIGKFGVDKALPRWEPKLYAKGTKNHPGGPAVVGDGPGRELVHLPNGKSFISPDTDTLLNLPKGTQVVPNNLTEKLLKSDVPHYAKGIGGLKDTISDVWEYVSNPSKLVSKVMSGVGLDEGLSQIPKEIAGAGLSYLKKQPVNYVKNLFKESGGGGKPAFGWPVTSPFGYRIHPITGSKKLHGGTDFGAPAGSPVPSQTGGTVSFAGGGWNGGFGNLVKVKQGMWEMFYAHLSKILVSAGQSIKKGDILGHVGSTGASTGPHLHYETRKNGQRVNPLSLKGFKTGGVIKSKMLAMLGEEDEEIVIPTAKNRRTDAMKLLALAAKKIGVDSGSYSTPGNLSTPKENEQLNEIIKHLSEQVDDTKEIVSLLVKLVAKNPDIFLDGRKVGELTAEHVRNYINDKEVEEARGWG